MIKTSRWGKDVCSAQLFSAVELLHKQWRHCSTSGNKIIRNANNCVSVSRSVLQAQISRSTGADDVIEKRFCDSDLMTSWDSTKRVSRSTKIDLAFRQLLGGEGKAFRSNRSRREDEKQAIVVNGIFLMLFFCRKQRVSERWLHDKSSTPESSKKVCQLVLMKKSLDWNFLSAPKLAQVRWFLRSGL